MVIGYNIALFIHYNPRTTLNSRFSSPTYHRCIHLYDCRLDFRNGRLTHCLNIVASQRRDCDLRICTRLQRGQGISTYATAHTIPAKSPACEEADPEDRSNHYSKSQNGGGP